VAVTRSTPKRAALLATALALLLGLGVALGANRTDRSFGENGVARVGLPPEAQRLGAGPVILDLADAGRGKMVAALGDFSGSSTYIGAARFRPDGSLDATFGDGGFAEAVGLRDGVITGLKTGQGQAVALQPDGKVLLAGYQAGFSSRTKAAPALVRFLPNGELDKSFGDDGKVVPTPKQARDEALHGVAVQAEGRIVAVGGKREHLPGQPAGLVIAYRPDGSVDRGFGRGGRLLFPARRGDKQYTGFRDVVALAGGKLLLSGYSQGRLLLVRLTATGRPDPSFGGDGRVLVGIGDSSGCLRDCGLASPVALGPGREITVAANLPLGRSVLVRLRPGGALDRGFGRGGIFRIRKEFFLVQGIAIDARGHLVVAGIGERTVGGHPAIVFATMRFRSGGSLDRGFGAGGTQSLPVGEASAALTAVAQPNGRVVVAGGTQFPNGSHRLVLTRYLSD
jgi:uncharacterized delta-60 repeat protein